VRHDCDRPFCFGNLWREATAGDKWRWFGVAIRVGDYDWGALEASPPAIAQSINDLAEQIKWSGSRLLAVVVGVAMAGA
jgi:hypothetical protein